MADIFVLAFAAALYPLLLAGVLLILTQPDPRGLLLAFLLGGMLVSLVAGTAILVAVDESGVLRPSSSSRDSVSPGVDIVAGLVSLGLAVVLARRGARPRPQPAESDASPSWMGRHLARGSRWPAFVVGIVLNLPGVWYLAALKEISAGNYATVTDAFLLVGFNVIMFALVEVPLVWYLVSPDGAQRFVTGMDRWFHTHANQLGVAITGLVGVYLCVRGVAGALS